jgi:type IV secretory pathway VirB3-like protein
MLWVALISAAALNIFLSVWSARNELIDPDSYKNLYTELQKLNDDNDKLAEYLKQRIDTISSEDYFTRILYSQANAQLKKVSSYEAYLEGIDNRAEKMTAVSIFADKDSFAYRSILRTPPAYKHLKGIQPSFINSKPITAATDTIYTDILAFLLIFLITMLLVLNEKDRGLFALLRPTKSGRVQLLFAKILAIYTVCIVIFFLLYAGKYYISTILYGSCDLSNVIQSVEGFLGSTLEISIGGYLIIYAVTKVAAYFLIASFLTFLCIIAKSGLFVYVTVSAYTIVSSLFYVLIKGNSYLSILKYINPVCLIDTNILYENYLDLNFFGQPINLLKVGIIMLIFGNVLLVAANLFIFAKQKNLIFHDSRAVQWFFNHIHIKRRVSGSLWRFEAYKILIINKA